MKEPASSPTHSRDADGTAVDRVVRPPTFDGRILERMPDRSPDVDIAEFDEGVVVFDARARQLHLLKDFSAVVFDSCDGLTIVSDLRHELVEAGVGDDDHASSIIADMLASFTSMGLLSGTEPAIPPPCIGCDEPVAAQPSRRFWARCRV